MSVYQNISVILPSLNPTYRLENTVNELISSGFNDIIVINDGSGAEFAPIFDKLKQLPQCTVLTHDENQGKGAALKTAFSYCVNNRPDLTGAITADADGQHLTCDICRCADELKNPGDIEETQHSAERFAILGVRDFRSADVPVHNSIGNRITAFAIRVLFNFPIRDSQTGLRALPANLLPVVTEIKGKRFEYETNMILELRRLGVSIVEIPIKAVYEEGSNERSNFRLVKDSIMIFLRISKYALSGVLCFLVDISAFTLLMLALHSSRGLWIIPFCTVIARLISSFLNFNINKQFVFKSKDTYKNCIVRYYTLVVVQMLAAASGLWLISLPFVLPDGMTPGLSNGVPLDNPQQVGVVTLLKIALDTVLFFLSYFVQHRWVFKNKS